MLNKCYGEDDLESFSGVLNRFDAVSAYMRKMDHYRLSDF